MIKFQDNFKNNKKKWSEMDDEECMLHIEDDGYIFDHKRDYGAWSTTNTVNGINWKKEYTITSTIEKLAGVDNYGYGIMWNTTNDNQFRYTISGDGHFRVLFKEGDNWHYIIDWTYSDHINQRDGINKLKITRKAKSINFYINDKFVARRGVSKYFNVNNEGVVGFVIDNLIMIKVHSLIVEDKANNKKTNKNKKNNIESLESIKKELNSLIGLDNIKKEIETLTNFMVIQNKRKEFGLKVSENNMHMVFMGPPGTGKTTIARLIGKLYKELGLIKSGHTVEVDRSALVGKWIGQTAPLVDEKIDEAEEGILFIDEAYALYVEDSPKDFGKEVIEVLIKRMEDKKFILIVAGYEEEMKKFLKSNPGFKSRFNRYLSFEDYSPKELLEIFKKFATDLDYTIDDEASEKIVSTIKVAFYSKDKNFGNARYIKNMFEKSIEIQATRLSKEKKLTKELLTIITKNDIPDNFVELS